MQSKLSRLWLVLMVAVGGLLIAAPAGALVGPVGPDDPDAERFGAVAGVVLDEHGERVADATVRLVHARTHRVVGTVHTDREGRFRFRHVRVGHCSVRAGKRHVGTGAARVGVRAHHVARVRIVLHDP